MLQQASMCNPAFEHKATHRTYSPLHKYDQAQ